MKQIFVCYGNACQKNEAIMIKKALLELVSQNQLDKQVEILEEPFCMGHCRRGATAKINNKCITNINMSNIEEQFYEMIGLEDLS